MVAGITCAFLALAVTAPATVVFAKSKPTVILVHGAFQNGPSTWSRVKPLLENDGYRVVVVNLPGRDNDGVDLKTLTTAVYRDKVLEVVNAADGPVVLVGHSFGGVTISNVAEAAPDKVKALVYLSAYLPQDGQSLMDLAKMDRDSNLGKLGNLILSTDYSEATIRQDTKADTFANDATGTDREQIVASLIPEATAPQGMPVKLTERNWGRVPKFYLETMQDHCVSPYLQEQMMSKVKLTKVTKIDAGHASYITKPQEVAAGIEAAAKD